MTTWSPSKETWSPSKEIEVKKRKINNVTNEDILISIIRTLKMAVLSER